MTQKYFYSNYIFNAIHYGSGDVKIQFLTLGVFSVCIYKILAVTSCQPNFHA